MRNKGIAFGILFSLITVLFFSVGTTSADAPAPYNAEEGYKLAKNATFYLRVLNGDGNASATGTGVILSAGGTAATAYHVVKGADRFEGVLADGTVVSPIKVLSYNELTDAAVIQLPDPKSAKVKGGAYPFLSVRKEALDYGEKVFALGYPLKNTPIITEGIVNSPDAMINGRSRVLTSAQIVSGMSGGPLIDEKGQLVGIISGSLRTMDNIHLVVNTNDVRSLLPTTLK